MSAYRYWRLWCISNLSYVVIAEIELRTSVGGADVTGSGTASANSVLNVENQASLAFNNDGVTTNWHSANTGSPFWIQYDFGAGVAYAVAEYAVTARGFSPEWFPNELILLASNDGVYWDFVDNRTDLTWSTGETKTFTVTPLVAGTPFQPSAAPVIDASHYWIHNVVDRLGVPGKYPVRLYNRASGALLLESKSRGTDGAYQFQFLPYLERGYQVIALDDPATRSDPKNAAIADLMTPEAMP